MFAANSRAGYRNQSRPEHLDGGAVFDDEVGINAYVNLYFNSDGTITSSGATSYTSTADGTWHTGSPTGSDYEIKADLDSGDTPTGSSLSTWLNLGSNQTWQILSTLPASGFTEKQCSMTITLRVAASKLVVASNTYTLYARSTKA